MTRSERSDGEPQPPNVADGRRINLWVIVCIVTSQVATVGVGAWVGWLISGRPTGAVIGGVVACSLLGVLFVLVVDRQKLVECGCIFVILIALNVMVILACAEFGRD